MDEKTAFPLTWPEGRPRTLSAHRHHARFKTTFFRAMANLTREIKLLGGDKIIFSTDIPLRKDGLPYSDMRPKSGDPGVAVYFTRKGKQLCFACDCYLTPDDNMHAIALTVEALRGIARWGTGDMMEAAFRGFIALPEKTGGVAWWEVLGVPSSATLEQAKAAYRKLVIKHHPDAGGDVDQFHKIREAWEQCERQKADA